MPVVKRQILPVQIARAQLQKTVKDDLEATAVNGIAGLIKQVLFRWKNIRIYKSRLHCRFLDENEDGAQRKVAMRSLGSSSHGTMQF